MKPLFSGHLRDLPKCPLERGLYLLRNVCERSTFSCYSVLPIKFHVVKEAIQSSSPLPFIINFHLFVNAKTLTYYSTYFKDVIQQIQYYVRLSIQSGIRLIEVLTIEISQIQLNSSARVRLTYRGVR